MLKNAVILRDKEKEPKAAQDGPTTQDGCVRSSLLPRWSGNRLEPLPERVLQKCLKDVALAILDGHDQSRSSRCPNLHADAQEFPPPPTFFTGPASPKTPSVSSVPAWMIGTKLGRCLGSGGQLMWPEVEHLLLHVDPHRPTPHAT